MRSALPKHLKPLFRPFLLTVPFIQYCGLARLPARIDARRDVLNWAMARPLITDEKYDQVFIHYSESGARRRAALLRFKSERRVDSGEAIGFDKMAFAMALRVDYLRRRFRGAATRSSLRSSGDAPVIRRGLSRRSHRRLVQFLHSGRHWRRCDETVLPGR